MGGKTTTVELRPKYTLDYIADNILNCPRNSLYRDISKKRLIKEWDVEREGRGVKYIAARAVVRLYRRRRNHDETLLAALELYVLSLPDVHARELEDRVDEYLQVKAPKLKVVEKPKEEPKKQEYKPPKKKVEKPESTAVLEAKVMLAREKLKPEYQQKKPVVEKPPENPVKKEIKAGDCQLEYAILELHGRTLHIVERRTKNFGHLEEDDGITGHDWFRLRDMAREKGIVIPKQMSIGTYEAFDEVKDEYTYTRVVGKLEMGWIKNLFKEETAEKKQKE